MFTGVRRALQIIRGHFAAVSVREHLYCNWKHTNPQINPIHKGVKFAFRIDIAAIWEHFANESGRVWSDSFSAATSACQALHVQSSYPYPPDFTAASQISGTQNNAARTTYRSGSFKSASVLIRVHLNVGVRRRDLLFRVWFLFEVLIQERPDFGEVRLRHPGVRACVHRLRHDP